MLHLPLRTGTVREAVIDEHESSETKMSAVRDLAAAGSLPRQTLLLQSKIVV